MKQIALSIAILIFGLSCFSQDVRDKKTHKLIERRMHRQHPWANNKLNTYGGEERVGDTLSISKNGSCQWVVDVRAVWGKDTMYATHFVNVLQTNGVDSIGHQKITHKIHCKKGTDDVRVSIRKIDGLAVVMVKGIESTHKLKDEIVHWEIAKSDVKK